LFSTVTAAEIILLFTVDYFRSIAKSPPKTLHLHPHGFCEKICSEINLETGICAEVAKRRTRRTWIRNGEYSIAATYTAYQPPIITKFYFEKLILYLKPIT